MARLGNRTIRRLISFSVEAEKLAALKTDTLLRERAGRADLDWFDRFMARPGGEAPSAEDTPSR